MASNGRTASTMASRPSFSAPQPKTTVNWSRGTSVSRLEKFRTDVAVRRVDNPVSMDVSPEARAIY